MPTTPRGKGKKAEAAKASPASAFKSGKFNGDTPLKGGRKDNRHVLSIKGFAPGVVTAYVSKYNAEEEPFFLYDYKLLQDNPGIMENLGINAIVARKGTDGETPMKQSATSTYNWRQFIFIIGEDNNTSAKRKALCAKLVTHFNKNATTANYQYPRKVKFGTDLSDSGMPGPVDANLLDEDVLGLMLAAYPSTPPEELATFDDVMGQFWTDLDHGREVLAAHAAGVEEEEEEKNELEDSDSDSE